MSISVCNFCRQLESDDVSELNDSVNVQQSSDSCALQEMQKVIIIFIFMCFLLCSVAVSFNAMFIVLQYPGFGLHSRAGLWLRGGLGQKYFVGPHYT